MAQLIIEIPDELANALDALALPPDGYCQRALEEAVARNAELRTWGDALIQKLPRSANNGVPRLYTIAEVAELLRVSVDKVTDMTNSGELDALHLGRRKLIPARAIDALIGP